MNTQNSKQLAKKIACRNKKKDKSQNSLKKDDDLEHLLRSPKNEKSKTQKVFKIPSLDLGDLTQANTSDRSDTTGGAGSASTPATPRKRPPKHIRKQMSDRLKREEEKKECCFIGNCNDISHDRSFLYYNKHITRGYRINFDTFSKLFKSLFMFHNESVNVWSHLIGMLIFFYLITHSFNKYEPIDFYYKTIANNEALSNADYGVPFQKLKSQITQKNEELWSYISTDKNHSLVINNFLDSTVLEEWIEKVNKDKENFQLFVEDQKSKNARNFEAMELYIQNAFDQLKMIALTPNITKDSMYPPEICKECIQNLMKLIEKIPNHLHQKIREVYEQIEEQKVKYQGKIDPKINLKFQMMLNKMTSHIGQWKKQILLNLEKPEFNVFEQKSIVPEEGIFIHYTPRWPLILHFACAICCFGFSSVYHQCNCHSKQIMTFFIRFDYAGICLMIAGSSTPPIYYSFGCPQAEFFRNLYLILIWGCCALTLIIMMVPYFDQDHFHSFRGFLFIFTGLVPLIPVVHLKYFMDDAHLNHFQVVPWAIGGLMYIFGAVFYITQFPEKQFKNRFDYIGNSHNIFHTMIILAALTHYYAAIQSFHERQIQSCPLDSQRIKLF